MAKTNTTKADTKKTVQKTGDAAVKNTTKKVEVVKKEETVKQVVKTTAAKTVVKADKKPTVKKPEVKEAVKPTAKAVEKAAPKKTEVKAAVKSETKTITAEKPVVKKVAEKTVKEAKPTVKKAVAKPVTKTVKEAVKAEDKKTTKTASKKATKRDLHKYDEISLGACLQATKEMGIGYEYADYCRLLLDEADVNKLEKDIIDGNQLADKKYDFAKDGYDLDVVMATLNKVAETMDLTAAEFKTIKKNMDACVKTELVVDADENAKNYLAELKVAEKVLMVGQRKNITTAAEVTALLKSDVVKFFDHLKKMAYAVLRNWKYEDVEFYQEFAFAFVSQYTDMFIDYQNEIQMDCADLYILHGDEGRGDHEYNYVLRENQIKDYIYYRFANVYVERNLDKAKSIAQSAFNWVDDRFDYYKKIVEIVEK